MIIIQLFSNPLSTMIFLLELVEKEAICHGKPDNIIRRCILIYRVFCLHDGNIRQNDLVDGIEQ